jgi:Nucleotidyl transferase AbiEii toxin, Type IV TA system
MSGAEPGEALERIAAELTRLEQRFALVGGFGVSLRAEVRFTRDVDVAVDVRGDEEVEHLVFAAPSETLRTDLAGRARRRQTIGDRPSSGPSGITVDLLTASSKIEAEIVARATDVTIEDIGPIPVAQAEELLAMKVLSMDARRLQDRIDSVRLLEVNADIDLRRVRDDLRLIEARGFSRRQDLAAKLDEVLESIRGGRGA